MITKIADTLFPRNPVTQNRELFRFIPQAFENALGANYYNDVCPPSTHVKGTEDADRVQTVFNKLVKKCPRQGMDWEIRLMNDNIVNAFCLPGGKVAITTGMMQKIHEPSDDENITLDDKIAAVLGHEITHAAAGHGARSMQAKILCSIAIKVASYALSFFIFQPKKESTNKEYEQLHTKRALFRGIFEMIMSIANFIFERRNSQSHELESDRYGIMMAAAAGYNPKASEWLQHMFISLKGNTKSTTTQKVLDFISTHPPSTQRLEQNKKTIAEIQKVGVPIRFLKDYK